MDTKGRRLLFGTAGFFTAVFLMGAANTTTVMASSIGIINTEDMLDIYARADDGSEIVGQVMDEGHVAILERDGSWVQIQAGDIVGWVPDRNLTETDISGEEAVVANEEVIGELAERIQEESAGEQIGEEPEASTETPAEESTEAPAEASTEAPAEESTETSMEESTEAATEEGTEASAEEAAEVFAMELTEEISDVQAETARRAQEQALAAHHAAAEALAAHQARELVRQQEEAEQLAQEQAKAAEEQARRQAEAARQRAEAEALAAQQKAAAEELAAQQKAAAEALAAQQKAEAEALAARQAEAQRQSVLTATGTSEEELRLLANIIYCEAGCESYVGKVAVGNVVMNRTRSGGQLKSISEVVYARGQFSPVRNGSLRRALANNSADASCYQAALDALSGAQPVGDKLFFRRVNGRSGQVIGNHVFY